MLQLVLVLLVGLLAACQPAIAARPEDVRVLFLTDCRPYSHWQAIGMTYSFKKSGQPGKVTRVACCTPEEKEHYSKEMLDYVETHIAPNLMIYNGDNYAAYNKPEAVIDYMEKNDPEEQWVLVLDSDMILRYPFMHDKFPAKPGIAYGARYDYMIGVNNQLADRHIPEIPRKNDTLAGPYGRRSDKVGGFFFYEKHDLRRMSKLWLKYTADVRNDTMAWKFAGDSYATKMGDKPWISEMYGYSFGAAKANVSHVWDENSMMYPGYVPNAPPRLLHYGLHWTIKEWEFDKHWYYDFDIYKCPPWDLSPKRPMAGLFPMPPHPSKLKQTEWIQYYKDILASETIVTLNSGLCEWHERRCPNKEAVRAVCDPVRAQEKDLAEAIAKAEADFSCHDHFEACAGWAAAGECDKNKGFMGERCPVSCNRCVPKTTTSLADAEAQVQGNTQIIPGIKAKEQQQQQQQVAAKQQQSSAEVAARQQAEKAKMLREQAQARAAKQRAQAQAQQKAQQAGADGVVVQTHLTAVNQGLSSEEIEKEGAKAAAEQQERARKAREEALRAARTSPPPASRFGEATVRNSQKTVKQLIIGCHHQPWLSVEQMKECNRQAHARREYTVPQPASPSPPPVEVKAPQIDGEEGDGTVRPDTTKIITSRQSEEDLLQEANERREILQEQVKPEVEYGKARPPGQVMQLLQASTKMPALWIAAGGLLVYASSRYVRRKRTRSGQRRE